MACSPFPDSLLTLQGEKLRVLLMLFRAKGISDISDHEKANVFSHVAPHGEHADTTLKFWSYVMFRPSELDKFVAKMIQLVHKFMRAGDTELCQCGCAANNLDSDAFMEAARGVMEAVVYENAPRSQLFRMGSLHSLEMGPSPVNPRPPTLIRP